MIEHRQFPPPVEVRNIMVGQHEHNGIMYPALVLNGVPYILIANREVLNRAAIIFADQVGRSGGPAPQTHAKP